MPRTARWIEAGTVYHVLNRGNGRMRLFHNDGDYEAFERVLTEGFGRYPLDRRRAGPPIHPPRSRLAAEDAKQSVMSPRSSPVGVVKVRLSRRPANWGYTRHGPAT